LEQGAQTGAIRARRFELTDERGRTIAVWGTDSQGSAVLAFSKPRGKDDQAAVDLDDPRNQRASMGVRPWGSPWIGFMGSDAQPRLEISLRQYEKPLLVLGDQSGGRVSLGIDEGDAPGPATDDWSLTFHPEYRAAIGMVKLHGKGQKRLTGFWSINNEPMKFH
jgi:hypothetical protein